MSAHVAQCVHAWNGALTCTFGICGTCMPCLCTQTQTHVWHIRAHLCRKYAIDPKGDNRIMPAYSTNLGKLTLFMSQNTTVDNPMFLPDIIRLTNINRETVRRLLKENPDIFVQKGISKPSEWYYVHSIRAGQILQRANLAGQRMETNAAPMPAQPLTPVDIPNKIPPVASQSDLPTSVANSNNWKYSNDTSYELKYKAFPLTKCLKDFSDTLTSVNYELPINELPHLLSALECLLARVEEEVRNA